MSESVFTKIINGQLPAHKVYEDEQTLAFLDIHPSQPGHTLVIPKVQIDHIWDLSDEDYQAVWATAKKVAMRLKRHFRVERVGVKVVGIDVPHAHVHLIPFNNMSQFTVEGDMSADPDHGQLAALAEELRF